MEGNSLVIPLKFWVKENYSPTNTMECNVMSSVLMGNC